MLHSQRDTKSENHRETNYWRKMTPRARFPGDGDDSPAPGSPPLWAARPRGAVTSKPRHHCPMPWEQGGHGGVALVSPSTSETGPSQHSAPKGAAAPALPQPPLHTQYLQSANWGLLGIPAASALPERAGEESTRIQVSQGGDRCSPTAHKMGPARSTAPSHLK